MANATADLFIEHIGKEGYIFDLPVDGGTQIFLGVLTSQLTATGMLVPFSTASASHCIGVATHGVNNLAGADGDKRCRVETKRQFTFANGAGGDAFADTDIIGSPVYATDDHTVAKTSGTGTRKAVGFFMGMESPSNGRVRVYIDPPLARLYAALAALTDSPATADALRDNLVAGVAV